MIVSSAFKLFKLEFNFKSQANFNMMLRLNMASFKWSLDVANLHQCWNLACL